MATMERLIAAHPLNPSGTFTAIELDYLNSQDRVAPSQGCIAWGWASGNSQNFFGTLTRTATTASDGYTYAYPTIKFSKLVVPHYASTTANTVAIALDGQGRLYTWGSNNASPLGRSTAFWMIPQVVGAFTDWTTIAAGNAFGLALRSNGTMYAWGAGTNGLQGRGNTTSYNAPTQVGTDADWANVWSLNGAVSFATKTNGTLWSTGLNTVGMTGLATTTGTTLTWTQVGTATDYLNCKITATGTGNASTIHLVKADGTLWVWGTSHVRMGIGTPSTLTVPTQVGTATDWATPIGGNTGFLCSKANGDIWGAGTLAVFSKTGTNTMALQWTAAQFPSWSQFIGTPAGTNGTYYLVTTDGDVMWTGDAAFVFSTSTAATSLTRIGKVPEGSTLATTGFSTLINY